MQFSRSRTLSMCRLESAILALGFSHRIHFHNSQLGAQGDVGRIGTDQVVFGGDTSIYPPGELNEFEADPDITVRDVVQAFYNVRNHLAPGDRIPDLYFSKPARNGLNGEVNALDILIEAARVIVRSSLLKILREGLTEHFMSASAAETYFDANDLTLSKIRARRHAVTIAVGP